MDPVSPSTRRTTRARRSGITVGEVRITFEDDDTAIFPLILGLNTNRMDARLRGSMLFDNAGALGIASSDTAAIDATAVERYLYRADWHNPRPEVVVKHVEFQATHPGVKLWVAGVGMALTPKQERTTDKLSESVHIRREARRHLRSQCGSRAVAQPSQCSSPEAAQSPCVRGVLLAPEPRDATVRTTAPE